MDVLADTYLSFYQVRRGQLSTTSDVKKRSWENITEKLKKNPNTFFFWLFLTCHNFCVSPSLFDKFELGVHGRK